MTKGGILFSEMQNLENSLPEQSENIYQSEVGTSFLGKLKTKWSVVLGILGSIAIFAVLIYAAYSYSKRGQETQLTPSPTFTVTPTITPILTPEPTAVTPTVSSEGKIAFVRDGDIWVTNPDGSEEKQITSDGKGIVGVSASEDVRYAQWEWPYYKWPQWAPDGSQLSFLKLDMKSSGNTYDYITSIFVWGKQNGQVRELTNDVAWGSPFPVWSNDSKEILYIAKTNNDTAEERAIKTITLADGSKEELVRYHESGSCGGAGDTIVHFYDQEAGGNIMGPETTLIWISSLSAIVVSTNCDHGSIKIFNYNKKSWSSFDENVAEIKLSPDTKSFVGVHKKETTKIFLLDLNGKVVDSIAVSTTVKHPLWSQDGTAIYFTSGDILRKYTITTENQATVVQLESYILHLVRDDENGIYFTRLQDGSYDPKKYLSIWHINEDSSGLRKVLDDAGQPCWVSK